MDAREFLTAMTEHHCAPSTRDNMRFATTLFVFLGVVVGTTCVSSAAVRVGSNRQFSATQRELAAPTPLDDSSIRLSWVQTDLAWGDQAENHPGFTIERSTTSAGPIVPVEKVAEYVQSYVDSELLPAIYFYRVNANSDVAASTWSEIASTSLLGNEACGDANNDGQISASDALVALRASVGTVVCGIERCDFNGDGLVSASDALGILQYAVGSGGSPACVIAGTPKAPSNLTATIVSSSQVNLAWSDRSNDETKFKIHIGDDPAWNGTYDALEVNAGVTSYQATFLTGGTLYCFRVVATNAFGDSPPSNGVCLTTPGTSKPDFLVTAFTANPNPPIANGTFSMDVTVKNQGAGAGNAGNLSVWINQSTARSCGAVADDVSAVGSLAAGASKTITFQGLPSGAAGAKTFLAFVDSGCSTSEATETNNQTGATYTVASKANKVMTSCVQVDTNTYGRMYNKCSEKISVLWSDSGACANWGCGTAIEPYQWQSITTLQGTFTYAACLYPWGPVPVGVTTFYCPAFP